NRFHVRTRANVIRSELLFREGERWDSSKVAESMRNLRALGVFRVVRIDSATVDSTFTARILTQDAWSSKPEFGFRSTGGQVAWRATLVEENLFGTASQFALGYSKDPDRSYLLLGLRRPRLIANTIGLGFQFQDRSDGHIIGGQLYRPFLSFTDRYGWSVGLDSRDERILRYFEGARVPRDTLQRQLGMFSAGLGRALQADAKDYHRLGVSGRLWQDEFVQGDSLFGTLQAVGTVGAFWEWKHSRYLVVSGFTTSREEDVDLSTSVQAGFSISPALFGFEQSGITPHLGIRVGGVLARRTFGYLDFNAHGRFTSAGLDSGAVQVGATAVYGPAERHTFVAHAWAGWLDNPRPGGEFDLGLGIGPRGFRLHAFSGNRGVFTTAEYRYLFALDWLKTLDLGIATFVDYGGAWYQGSERRTGWNTGVGLRIGPSRATDQLMTRIDLVFRPPGPNEPGDVLIVIGRGLVFSTAGILSR
ncbi:MAG TPA: hypothetical protein VLL51_07585, partial [Gemmatimonadales bacterium]|nr:hypothetical protein [Gemmatimonadales bacterium]